MKTKFNLTQLPNEKSFNQCHRPAFPELQSKLVKENDFLTSYQIEFQKNQEASKCLSSQKNVECSLRSNDQPFECTRQTQNEIFGAKTSGKLALDTHQKNVSHLYYLLDSSHAKMSGLIDKKPQVNLENSEEHFKFGTYHWKRSDVTKNFHPGLAYR